MVSNWVITLQVGYIGVITHLLTFYQHFQRDIQVEDDPASFRKSLIFTGLICPKRNDFNTPTTEPNSKGIIGNQPSGKLTEPWKILIWVVATQRFFIFTPNLGDMIQFDEHIFQRGWFNHQPVIFADRKPLVPIKMEDFPMERRNDAESLKLGCFFVTTMPYGHT